jgi:four helix bundle protein
MTKWEMMERTRRFHLDVLKLCGRLPRNTAAFETARQLVRAAGSVGANYRAIVRAKSTADFAYKNLMLLEEADESHYWLQIIKDAGMSTEPEIDRLIDEAHQLTSIFASTNNTIKNKTNK